MDPIRSLQGIRRMDSVLNAQIRELCRVTKGLMKVFSGGLEMDRIAKRECWYTLIG